MLATILVADDGDLVGGIPQERLRGFGIAPPRAVSLDLAVKYAHVVNGVILQVRTPASPESCPAASGAMVPRN